MVNDADNDRKKTSNEKPNLSILRDSLKGFGESTTANGKRRFNLATEVRTAVAEFCSQFRGEMPTPRDIMVILKEREFTPDPQKVVSTMEKAGYLKRRQPKAASRRSTSGTASRAAKAPKKTKSKSDQPFRGRFQTSDLKKTEAFVNSVGGLEKAFALIGAVAMMRVRESAQTAKGE